jgi:outer membrane protein TolC
MKSILVILLAFACSGTAAAEIRTITLESALRLAMDNNLTLLQAEKDWKIADAQYKGSMSEFFMPSLSVSAGVTYIDPETVSNNMLILPLVIPEPTLSHLGMIVITDQPVFSDNYSGSASISKPLFAGFRLWNSLKLKKVGLDLAKAKYEDAKRDLTARVTTGFYNLFLLRENLRLTSDFDRSLKDRLDSTRDIVKAGLAAEFDMVRAEVAYKRNQPVLRKMENAVTAAKLDFCDTIGVADPDGVEFVGNLLDSTNIRPETTGEESLALAISNDVNLKSLDASIESLRISADIAAGSRYPVVSAFFKDSLDWADAGIAATNRSWVNSWNTGIQVSMALDTLLPFSKTAYTVEETSRSVEKALLARKQVVEGIELRVKTLLMQIDQARESIDSQADTLRQAKIALDIANSHYKAGTASSLDVNDAEDSYNQTQVSYLQAVYDYFSSVIQLRRLTGV